MEQLYAKTPKGVEEMTSRVHGLGQRARRLLIMVDGKRDLAGFVAALPGEDVHALFDQLIADGFIRALEPPPKPAPAPAAAAAPAKPAAPPPPAPANEGERFAMARNFMVNTVSAFLGIMGSSLIDKLEGCDSLEELRAHYAAWREAIQMSREGKHEFIDLDSRLAALLS